MGFLLLPKTAERSGILGTEWLGYANCVSVFVLFRAAPFSTLASGVFEPRRRFTLTGGEFFAEPQQGIALCGARETAASAAGTTPYPRRWAKRKDNLRFSFLFELLPFPCFLIWRRLPTCDRSEIGYGRGFFLPCLSQPIRSARQNTATQVVYSTQGQHNSVARLAGTLCRKAPADLGVITIYPRRPCLS